MTSNLNLQYELNEREQDILRSIVNLYVLKAVPVGSRKLSKYLEGRLDLSAATLRNIMSDLEELDYINHPHTSAGRVPTDKGYRFYVDSLIKIEDLTNEELKFVNQLSEKDTNDKALKEAGKILSYLSQYLGVVRIPHLRNLIVKKVQLINLSSSKVLIVVALESNIIRHVTLEADFEIKHSNLEKISDFINDKVSGRTLKFISENFSEMMHDLSEAESPLIRLFVDSVDQIFHMQNEEQIITTGTQNLLNHPEFEDLNKVRSIIELVEEKDLVIHLLDKESSYDGTKVVIGGESGTDELNDYSLVVSDYKIGSAIGSIGLIGPKRMNYGKMMALVDSVSSILSRV